MFNPALNNKSVTDLVCSKAQIKVAGFDVIHVSFAFLTRACLKETRLLLFSWTFQVHIC